MSLKKNQENPCAKQKAVGADAEFGSDAKK